jgi:hypothetical protein
LSAISFLSVAYNWESFYLLQGNSVVLQEQKSIITDGYLDLLNEILNDSRVIRVQQREVNLLELSEVVFFLGHWSRDPFGDKRFTSSGRGTERSSRCHDFGLVDSD